MSRSAAALAYDLPVIAPRRPGPALPEVRLLGGEGRTASAAPAHATASHTASHAAARTGPHTLSRTATFGTAASRVQPEFPPYVRLVKPAEQPWSAYAPEPKAAATERRVKQPLWLAASGALVLVLAVVLLNGFGAANGKQSGHRLYMAGFPAAASADAPRADAQPAVIDVSTKGGPQDPAPAAAPAVSKSSGDYDITGGPTISVAQIERVLAQYGSPAVGKGQALYDLGVRYGINPAYGLAFFVHESGCGTKGVARFTHSLGNIRWTDGFDSYEGYRSYPSWEAGMEDWYKLITDLYINGWGLRTLDKIIPVYAPYGDSNNPPVYIQSVKDMVDSWRGK